MIKAASMAEEVLAKDAFKIHEFVAKAASTGDEVMTEVSSKEGKIVGETASTAHEFVAKAASKADEVTTKLCSKWTRSTARLH